MPFISRVEARAYSRATELIGRVTDAVLNLYPEDIRDFVEVTTESVERHKNGEIVVISAVLEKRSMCERTLDQIIESLSEQDREALRHTLSQRIDDQCILFLRIDKQASFLGELRLARDSDIISVRVHLRDYPRCKFSDAETFLADRLQYSGDTSL